MNVKIALCQINTIVGDLQYNFERICGFIEEAKAKGAKIICFPELSLLGYPPEDILFYPYILEKQFDYLERIKKYSEDSLIVIGFANFDDYLYNSAAVFCQNQMFVYNKINLPNYGVFDEDRYFKKGNYSLIIDANKIRIGFTICEDLWYPNEPILSLVNNDVDIVVNISASPYHVLKPKLREEIFKVRAIDYSVFILFCNSVGGQDELIFDGTSSIIKNDGKTLFRAPSFKEKILIGSISVEDLKLAKLNPLRKNQPKSNLECKIINTTIDLLSKDYTEDDLSDFYGFEEEIFNALVLGTRDYIFKNKFNKVLVAMSGGIDSSLVSCIAAEAVGHKNVLGVSMPSMFSSSHSVEDAQILAKNLGIDFVIIPISKIYDTFINSLDDVYSKFGNKEFTVAEENLQARIRGNIIMTISNKFNYLVLACGNKSEMSMGYATLYGDLAGGFAPIKDIYKSDVYRIARWYNTKKNVIPERVFIKAPSAELRPNQTDQDTLPPYDILDKILKLYLENNYSPEYISQICNLDKEFVKKVIKQVEISEYKRRQAPPGIKVSVRAFGKDRRLPITKNI